MSASRIAFADPPYPGQSEKHYSDHPDYLGEVNVYDLARQLTDYDGWVLHTSSPALFYVQSALRHQGFWPMHEDGSHRAGNYRVMAWVKSFAAFKRNVPVAYAWEPVLVKPVRKPVVLRGNDTMALGGDVMPVSRDWIAAPMTMQRGLVGAKPEAVCRWLFQVVGAEPDDELVDLYPGSGAVTRAWERWRSERSLFSRADS